MKRLLLLWLCAVMLASFGCAERKAYVVARHDPLHPVSKADKIAVSEPSPTQSRGEELYRALIAELKAGGFQIVAPDEAAFKLVVLVDRHARAVAVPPQLPVMYSTTQVVIPGGSYIVAGPPMRDGPLPRLDKEYRESEGIRLSLYPARVLNPAQLQTAWDGYVDSGHARLVTERERTLLRTLLSYLGQDFVGFVRLPE